MTTLPNNRISGSHAIVGLDVVGFSRLSNDDQMRLVQDLIGWVKAALGFHGVGDKEYRWSPAGDGGYITFQTSAGCEAAIDVAFSIIDKANRAKWVPKGSTQIPLRFAVHAGTVEEGEEIGGTTNIWGEGINTAARILSICGPCQILASEQYYQQYLENKPNEHGMQISSVYHRTVKHGVQIRVRNVSTEHLGLSEEQAGFRRWSVIGYLWQRACEEYDLLISDCMNSNNPVAALAASKFLMSLDPRNRAADALFSQISHFRDRREPNYEPREHPVFSAMPPAALKGLIVQSIPRLFKKGDVICKDGDVAESCFFPVYGTIEVELNIDPKPTLGHGAIVGEFGLWIPGIRRTATLKAKDDCLLLEVRFMDFEEIIKAYAGVGGAIAAMIQQRILSYVVQSRQFFPDPTPDDLELLTKTPSCCEKYQKGSSLNLATKTYILFNGKLKVRPKSDRQGLDVAAPGRFGHEKVVGIVTQITQFEDVAVDGETATVEEDSVVVSFPRESLLKIFQRNESVASAWDGLAGIRQGEFIRIIRKASRPVTSV